MMPGENLWIVSQRYGVKLKKLQKYNRLSSGEDVSPGTMLWLASTRPKTAVVQDAIQNAVAVDSNETFNWSADSGAHTVVENKDTLVVVMASVESGVAEEMGNTEITPEVTQPDSLKILQESVVDEAAASAEVTTLQSIKVDPPKALATRHTVQAGETLYAIAKMYQIGVMDLVSWNKLDLQQGIKPGQVLKLSEDQIIDSPAIAQKPSKEVFHEVKSSDTLYSIARQYGVTIKELMDWNAKKDFSLAVGEKLKIHQHR